MRGRVHMHFDSIAEAEAALDAIGFAGTLLDPNDFALPDLERAGASRVKIVEAITR